MDTLDSAFGIFDDSFSAIVNEMASGWWRFEKYLMWFIGAITTIQIAIMLIKYAVLGKPDETAMQLLLKIVFWWVIAFSFPHIMVNIKWAFVRFGAITSGAPILAKPSSVLKVGWQVATPILITVTTLTDNVEDSETSGTALSRISDFADLVKVMFLNFPKMVIGLAIWAVVLACYGLIMAQFFLAYAEFALISGIGVVLIPFGIMKLTQFMPEKLIGSIVGHGVKLMLLQFVIGIGLTIFGKGLLELGQTVQDVSYLSLITIAINAIIFAVLCMNIPAMATGILAGQPTLSSQSIQQTALAGGMAARGMKSLASSSAGGGAKLLRGGLSAAGGVARAGAAAKIAGGETQGGLKQKALGGMSAMGSSLRSSIGGTVKNKAANSWNNLTSPEVKAGEGKNQLVKMHQSKLEKSTSMPDFFKRQSREGGIAGRAHAKERNKKLTGLNKPPEETKK